MSSCAEWKTSSENGSKQNIHLGWKIVHILSVKMEDNGWFKFWFIDVRTFEIYQDHTQTYTHIKILIGGTPGSLSHHSIAMSPILPQSLRLPLCQSILPHTLNVCSQTAEFKIGLGHSKKHCTVTPGTQVWFWHEVISQPSPIYLFHYFPSFPPSPLSSDKGIHIRGEKEKYFLGDST